MPTMAMPTATLAQDRRRASASQVAVPVPAVATYMPVQVTKATT